MDTVQLLARTVGAAVFAVPIVLAVYLVLDEPVSQFVLRWAAIGAGLGYFLWKAPSVVRSGANRRGESR